MCYSELSILRVRPDTDELNSIRDEEKPVSAISKAQDCVCRAATKTDGWHVCFGTVGLSAEACTTRM